MTDRFKGLVVTFDRDIREDDAEGIINAIKHIRGVISVEPSVSDVNDHMNRVRMLNEMRTKVYNFFDNELK